MRRPPGDENLRHREGSGSSDLGGLEGVWRGSRGGLEGIYRSSLDARTPQNPTKSGVHRRRGKCIYLPWGPVAGGER
eukprot:521663-Prorocentrum_minimum.AAC.1